MGNRAVITTPEKKLGVYLHWNGGRDSVSAFLKYCKLKGFRSPDQDCYGWARLCEVICNYFQDGLSVGIDLLKNLNYDNNDNGVYIIKDWEIVGRENFRGAEQNEYSLLDMLRDINSAQPESMKLEDEVLLKATQLEKPEEVKVCLEPVYDQSKLMGWKVSLDGIGFNSTSLDKNEALIEALKQRRK